MAGSFFFLEKSLSPIRLLYSIDRWNQPSYSEKDKMSRYLWYLWRLHLFYFNEIEPTKRSLFPYSSFVSHCFSEGVKRIFEYDFILCSAELLALIHLTFHIPNSHSTNAHYSKKISIFLPFDEFIRRCTFRRLTHQSNGRDSNRNVSIK